MQSSCAGRELQAWRRPSREGDTMEGWGACMSDEEMSWGRDSQIGIRTCVFILRAMEVLTI